MGICKQCGVAPTSEGYDICRDCENKSKAENVGTREYDKKLGFAMSLIKGRIAETMVEQLFVALNWKVYRYGMEHTVPEIMREDICNRDGFVAQTIRKMPDFVVQDRNGNLFFAEVKFSKSEGSHENFKKSLGGYPRDAYIIVVSKKHILSARIGDFIDRGEKELTYFAKQREFNFSESDTEIIKKFCGIIEKIVDEFYYS